MLCHLCLLDVDHTIGVSEEEGKQLNIAEILSKHFWFKDNDILSFNICTICWGKTNDFHEFYKIVEKSHKDYKNAMIKEEYCFLYSNDVKEEQLDAEEYTNDNRELQIEVGIDLGDSCSMKNPLADNEPADCEVAEDVYHEKDDTNITTGRDKLPKKHKKETSLCNTFKDRQRMCKKKKLIIKTENNVEPKRKKAIFNRLDPLHTEEMIKKHIPMGCNLCVFVGNTFADIVAHFKIDHPNIRAYITCCDKTFTKRFYVAQHAMTHENPNCFSCNLCNKSFTTTGGLQKHNLKYHAPDEDLTFACDLCPQKFARQHLLQLHKPSHIPREEWKFFCTKCSDSKVFASAYLLNIHDNKLHKREKNICNVCAKEIRDKKSFEKHVKEHYEGSGPRLKCPFANCDSWLKDESNLKSHLRRHNTDGEIYKCPLCDKICPNRIALSSHKVYVHSKEVFKCGHCDKTFKRAITLKEHMTQHTGEILYNCPFCTKTFNSNANMHSHKKRQHPVEWEALRKQKMGNNFSKMLVNTNSIY